MVKVVYKTVASKYFWLIEDENGRRIDGLYSSFWRARRKCRQINRNLKRAEGLTND